MTYLNPVYPQAAPDPFVLKYCGEYYGYFTGIRPDGRCFGILHSADLVHWTPAGSALDPLPGDFSCYWAPEVTYHDGVFYLYYAVGNEETMHIRVATADQPTGPFVDQGRDLTSEQFAIDAHVLIDDDGQWYLFYAADFLEVERVGTGTVVDRFLDPFTLEGNPRPVTLAHYDWQIYHPKRPEKGGLRWHTVEGPFVLKHKGLYYQMFSGGNWQNDTYGVAYGLSASLDRQDEWEQPCDSNLAPLVLRSMPQIGIIGPGHNSVVRGPDNRELYCVYHRWDKTVEDRVLCIDRLDWEPAPEADTADILRVYGPSNTEQPGPAQPQVAGFEGFQIESGSWRPVGSSCRLEAGPDASQVTMPLPGSPFFFEISLRFAGYLEDGETSLIIEQDGSDLLRLSLHPARNELVLSLGGKTEMAPLPERFNPIAFHLLRVEVGTKETCVYLDDNRMRWQLPALPDAAANLRLVSQNAEVAFAGFALTV